MFQPFRPSSTAPTPPVRRLLAWAVSILLALGAVLTTVLPAQAATPAPTGLKVTASGITTLDLSWKAVSGAPRYRVQYATTSSMSDATYKRVTEPELQLTGLASDQTYYVKVRVITADGDNLSKYSHAVKATTAKAYAAPSGLARTSATATTVALTWKSRGSGLRYRVQSADDAAMSGASYQRFSTTSGTIGGLTAGTAYWFKVRVISSSGDNLSPYSAAVKVSTSAASSSTPAPVSSTKQLRLGTFNVKCFNCEADQPNERSWWDRRADVVRDIRSQDLDVLGVQEASQAWLPKVQGGKGQDLSQFEDLRNRLGGTWKLTNANRNNCVKEKTPTKCRYKDQGASRDSKILYDSASVSLVSQGSKLLPSPDDDRFMAWAILKQRSTGKKFFFVTTHLEPSNVWNLHVQEATALAKEVAKRNPSKLPTFITGDMNAHKNTLNPSGVKDNPVFDVIVGRYGYVDPLGNPSGSTTTTPGATVEHRINTPLSSFNDFIHKASPNYFGRRPNGTYLDYIFTSKKVRVLEWENVAKLDADHNYIGKQASDHNLQRATVVLP
ncbi:MAG TPA: fibronectin type III domain-containing protein [Friedmanniella sp.]